MKNGRLQLLVLYLVAKFKTCISLLLITFFQFTCEVKRRMYQGKVDVDMLNTTKSVLAEVSGVSPSSEQTSGFQLSCAIPDLNCDSTTQGHKCTVKME